MSNRLRAALNRCHSAVSVSRSRRVAARWWVHVPTHQPEDPGAQGRVDQEHPRPGQTACDQPTSQHADAAAQPQAQVPGRPRPRVPEIGDHRRQPLADRRADVVPVEEPGDSADRHARLLGDSGDGGFLGLNRSGHETPLLDGERHDSGFRPNQRQPGSLRPFVPSSLRSFTSFPSCTWERNPLRSCTSPLPSPLEMSQRLRVEPGREAHPRETGVPKCKPGNECASD